MTTNKIDILSKGKVSFTQRDSNGKIVKTVEVNNLLLDAYFKQNEFGPEAYIEIGSGVDEPTPTDTALSVFEMSSARTTSTKRSIVAPPGYENKVTNEYTYSRKFTFSEDKTITEVGLRSVSPPQPLLTRAIIKDLDGIPQPFTMEAGHELDVVYTLTVEIPRQLTEVATIESPWPAPYDGDISVVIAASDNSPLRYIHTISPSGTSPFDNVPAVVDHDTGKITYTLRKATSVGATDLKIGHDIAPYTCTLDGVEYYTTARVDGGYFQFGFRQENPGSDKRLTIPANHNFEMVFEYAINWGRKP